MQRWGVFEHCWFLANYLPFLCRLLNLPVAAAVLAHCSYTWNHLREQKLPVLGWLSSEVLCSPFNRDERCKLSLCMTRALCFSFHFEINHLIGYCSAEAQQLSRIKGQWLNGMNASETTQRAWTLVFLRAEKPKCLKPGDGKKKSTSGFQKLQ